MLTGKVVATDTMDISFNISTRYRLTFGHDESTKKNGFGMKPLEDGFCLRCSAKEEGGSDNPMRVWSYYHVQLEPHAGGMKSVFYPISRDELLCQACKEKEESDHPRKCPNCESLQKPPSSPPPSRVNPTYLELRTLQQTTPLSLPTKKKRGGRKLGSTNKKRKIGTSTKSLDSNLVSKVDAITSPAQLDNPLGNSSKAPDPFVEPYDPSGPSQIPNPPAELYEPQEALDFLVQTINDSDLYDVFNT